MGDINLNMLVSVIIPALNEENYLERCLSSLSKQEKYDNFEIIVVDGGSTDNTVKIAKKYADKVIISREKSPSVQRNLGAKIARGKILAFVDADTVVSKLWVKSVAKSFQNDNIACVTGPLFPLEKIKRFYLYTLTNALQKFLIKINLPLLWGASCAFRSDTFWEIGGFDKKLLTSEDHDISLRIRKIGKIFFNENMLAFTSHRRFLDNEKKAFFFYMQDILEYFFLRKIKKYSINLDDYKINLRVNYILREKLFQN